MTDTLRVYTLDPKTRVLNLYELNGAPFKTLLGRVKRLPTPHREWKDSSRCWWVSPVGLSRLQELGPVQEVPPLRLFPWDGQGSYPKPGVVEFQVQLFQVYEMWAPEATWTRATIPGTLKVKLDVSDLLKHPERGMRTEIYQEQTRRTQLVAVAVREHFLSTYMALRTGPQTEEHAVATAKAAIAITLEHFQKHPVDVQPVTISQQSISAGRVASMVPIDPIGATRHIMLVFEDGSVSEQSYLMEDRRMVRAHKYSANGEQGEERLVTITPREAQMLEDLLLAPIQEAHKAKVEARKRKKEKA